MIQLTIFIFFCFVFFILYIPVNNFQLCQDGSTSTMQGIICLAQSHNKVTAVRLRPATPQSNSSTSTTELCLAAISSLKVNIQKQSINN